MDAVLFQKKRGCPLEGPIGQEAFRCLKMSVMPNFFQKAASNKNGIEK
jgi:hypothetical protein